MSMSITPNAYKYMIHISLHYRTCFAFRQY